MDRDTFLAPQELRTFDVEIDGLGVVCGRELSESERVKQFDLWLRPGGELHKGRQTDSRLKLITLCLVNDAGETFLEDKDIPALRKKPARIISQLTELAMKCAGLSEDDLSEQLKKKQVNSDETSDV